MPMSIGYNRDQLIALSKPTLRPRERPQIPGEFKRRRRGCRASAKQRARRRKYKKILPSIVMGNVRSLGNKMDDNSESCHLQKFSDDCAVMGCVSGGEETEYRKLVDQVVAWCEQTKVQLQTL